MFSRYHNVPKLRTAYCTGPFTLRLDFLLFTLGLLTFQTTYLITLFLVIMRI